MARTPEEVDALIDQLETEQQQHTEALEYQGAINEETTTRFGRITNLLDQYNVRMRGIEDRTEANDERLNRHDRRIGRLSNPLFTLLIGIVALAGWLALSFWIKATVGDNVKVWMDAKEILWRDHPNFGDIAGKIIGGGAAFIVGMTLICLVIDLISSASPRQRRQNPPPVVAAEDLEDEGNEGGDEPHEEPTQVHNPPVHAGG
jgi:hypothetical protein